jgi:hypothetical protein
MQHLNALLEKTSTKTSVSAEGIKREIDPIEDLTLKVSMVVYLQALADVCDLITNALRFEGNKTAASSLAELYRLVDDARDKLIKQQDVFN